MGSGQRNPLFNGKYFFDSLLIAWTKRLLERWLAGSRLICAQPDPRAS